MFWRKPRDVEFRSPLPKAKASVKSIVKYDSDQRLRITRSRALQILVLLNRWAVFTTFVLFCSAVIYWFYTAKNASVWGVLSRNFGSKSTSAVYTFWGLPIFCAIEWLFPGKIIIFPWNR